MVIDFVDSLTANFESIENCNLINKPDIKILHVKLTLKEIEYFPY